VNTISSCIHELYYSAINTEKITCSLGKQGLPGPPGERGPPGEPALVNLDGLTQPMMGERGPQGMPGPSGLVIFFPLQHLFETDYVD